MDKKVLNKNNDVKLSELKQFNNYVKVANPSTWIILISILTFIIGLFIWSVFAVLKTKARVVVVSKNGDVIFYIKEEYMTQISDKSMIKIKGEDYNFFRPNSLPMMVTQDFDPYTLHIGRLEYGQWVYPVKIASSLPEGIYEADIIIETAPPITFVFN